MANPRTVASAGPRSPRQTQHFATSIRGEPQLALACIENGFLMQVYFHVCSMENFIVVRSVMPLYQENIHGLYSKHAARQWAGDLQQAGFRPLTEVINGN